MKKKSSPSPKIEMIKELNFHGEGWGGVFGGAPTGRRFLIAVFCYRYPALTGPGV